MVVSYTTSPITGVNACRCVVVNLFIVKPLTAVDVNVNAVALALPRIGVTNVGGVINIGATSGAVSMQFASGIAAQTSTIYGNFPSGFQSKITLTKIA